MKLLGKGGLLEDIKLNLRISDWSDGLPFKWNETFNQLEMKKRRKHAVLGLRLGIATIYFFLALIQAVRVWKQASLMVITHCILTFSCWVLTLSCQFPNFLQLSGVVQLCNGFIQLEQNFTKYFENSKSEPEKKSTSDLSLRGMIYLLTSAGLTASTVFCLDIYRNPCFPVYVGYWMHSQCEADIPGYYLPPTWSFEEVWTKVVIAMPALVVWTPLLCGCCFQIALEFVMQGNCFRVGIADFGKKLVQIQKENTSDLRKLTLFHRQLQIMSTHYRLHISKFMVGFAIPSFIALQTACLYNTISVLSGKDTGGPIWYNFLYAYVAVVIFFDVIFVFGILADVYEVSKSVREQISGNTELNKNKWFQRWIRSCPIFRIYFGGSNYLEKLTPATIQDFVIDQTVSLMLLQN